MRNWTLGDVGERKKEGSRKKKEQARCIVKNRAIGEKEKGRGLREGGQRGHAAWRVAIQAGSREASEEGALRGKKNSIGGEETPKVTGR